MTPEINDVFKRKVFGAYFGCEVAQMVNEKKSIYGPMVTIDQSYCGVMMPGNETISGSKLEYCKLLLRDLSQITDEHAIEVAKILIPNCFANCKNGWNVSRDFAVTGYPYIKIHHHKKVYSVQIDSTLCNFDIDNMEERETGSHDMKPAHIIDYLRSKYYNIPFQGVDLVAAGIAIIKE